jgi:hypothetical protein
MAGSEIASAVESGITSQSQLITTLSLAVIAGLVGVLWQSRLHNATHPRPIHLRCFPFFILAVTCAGIAIALNYVVAGMLIEMAPQLFSHAFDATKSFSTQDFSPAPISRLRLVSLIQFFVFFVAIAAGATFVFCNRKD